MPGPDEISMLLLDCWGESAEDSGDLCRGCKMSAFPGIVVFGEGNCWSLRFRPLGLGLVSHTVKYRCSHASKSDSAAAMLYTPRKSVEGASNALLRIPCGNLVSLCSVRESSMHTHSASLVCFSFVMHGCSTAHREVNNGSTR